MFIRSDYTKYLVFGLYCVCVDYYQHKKIIKFNAAFSKIIFFVFFLNSKPEVNGEVEEPI